MEKSRPAPKSTYEPSKEQMEVEKMREENRRRAMHKLSQTRALSQDFMKTDKSSKTQEKLAKIVDEREKNLRFNHFRALPPPKVQVGSSFFVAVRLEIFLQTNPIPVKLNLAAVLKESQLYRKQEDDVRRRLMDYEAGGKDDQQFVQWKQTMQKQDYQEELNHIERKRLEGKLSYEEAILARQRLADENAKLAEDIRRETREAVENLVKEKLKEEQRMK